jgi:beta-phosphoglucomutase
MSATVRAVLFDFDGVIVNSEPLHCRAYLETATKLDLSLTEERYYRELIGMDDRGAIEHLYRSSRRPFDQSAYQQFISRKTDLFQHLARNGMCSALPGVRAFLDVLRSANCAVGICSGALRAEIELMLDGIGLRDRFDAITSAEDVRIGKPDPGGYLLTARRLSEKIAAPPLSPRDCLVIEDAPIVALRAADAGFNVIGVTTTFARHAWPREIATVASLEPPEVVGALPQLHLNRLGA